jgi:hypothetical protein
MYHTNDIFHITVQVLYICTYCMIIIFFYLNNLFQILAYVDHHVVKIVLL